MEQLKLKNQLCFPLYAAAKDMVRRYKPLLDPLGLTYTQYIVLLVLWERGESNIKALGEALHLDSGTLTPVLKRLEQQGLIVRGRSAADERNLAVSLTAAGEALQLQAAQVPLQIGKCLNLSPEEAKVLYTLLYKLLEVNHEAL